MSLNQSLFLLVHGFANRSAILDFLGIFFAQYLPYLMVGVFLILAYYQVGWRRKLYVFAEGAVAIMISRGLVTEIIRFFYHHERPFSFFHFVPLIPEAGWSFPSGHMAWFFALSMAVWYFNRRWGIAYVFLSALMGLARIYVGVHWPLDILGGAVVGVLSAMFVHWIFTASRRPLYPAAVA